MYQVHNAYALHGTAQIPWKRSRRNDIFFPFSFICLFTLIQKYAVDYLSVENNRKAYTRRNEKACCLSVNELKRAAKEQAGLLRSVTTTLVSD